MNDNSPFVMLKDSIKDGWREQILDKIIMQDIESTSQEVEKIKELICHSKTETAIINYLECVEDFINKSCEEKRSGKALWLKSHLVDFERSDFDKRLAMVNESLYDAVSTLAVDVTDRLQDQIFKEDKEYIVDLVNFMTSESVRMKSLIQDYSIGRFKYNIYTRPRGILSL